MKKILIVILTFALGLNLKAQEEDPIDTIPLEKEIQVQIIEVDSTTLSYYNLYNFTYGERKIHARFWIPKTYKTFKNGIASVKLCRILEMRFNDSISLRGRALYDQLALFENDSIVEEFNFNEFGDSPTLRFCSDD